MALRARARDYDARTVVPLHRIPAPRARPRVPVRARRRGDIEQ